MLDGCSLSAVMLEIGLVCTQQTRVSRSLLPLWLFRLANYPWLFRVLEQVQVVACPKSEAGGPDSLLHRGVEGILLLPRSPPEPWGFLT